MNYFSVEYFMLDHIFDIFAYGKCFILITRRFFILHFQVFFYVWSVLCCWYYFVKNFSLKLFFQVYFSVLFTKFNLLIFQFLQIFFSSDVIFHVNITKSLCISSPHFFFFKKDDIEILKKWFHVLSSSFSYIFPFFYFNRVVESI